MKILKDFGAGLRDASGNDDVQTPITVQITFLLLYGQQQVGFLMLQDGVWQFAYTDSYKINAALPALPDFPDKERTYRSPILWAFFAHRIPGLKQPAIQEIIRREHIDPHNEVDLLRRFGRAVISNPYVLQTN
jgi:HipA-like protein